jgi:hypothetical protein
MFNNNIKLSVVGRQYFFNKKKKTVTCKMSYKLKMDKSIENAFTYLMKRNPCLTQTVSSTAYLADGDTFDKKKGMQVARAKAESMAYKEMVLLMNSLRDILNNIEMGIIEFGFKVYDTINHNKEYLKTF